MAELLTIEVLRELLAGRWFGVLAWQVALAALVLLGLHEWGDKNRLGAYLLFATGVLVLCLGLELF